MGEARPMRTPPAFIGGTLRGRVAAVTDVAGAERDSPGRHPTARNRTQWAMSTAGQPSRNDTPNTQRHGARSVDRADGSATFMTRKRSGSNRSRLDSHRGHPPPFPRDVPLAGQQLEN